MTKKLFLFQVSMLDNIVFNHKGYLDSTRIEPCPYVPVLHIVDRETHFSAAWFAPIESTEEVRNMFVSSWFSICIEFPNITSHHKSNLFTGQFFPDICTKFRITCYVYFQLQEIILNCTTNWTYYSSFLYDSKQTASGSILWRAKYNCQVNQFLHKQSVRLQNFPLFLKDPWE